MQKAVHAVDPITDVETEVLWPALCEFPCPALL